MFKIFVLFILLTIPILAAPIYNPTTGHWYVTVSGDWFTAESNAVALGGHLVTINDLAEQNWLITNFGSTRYWIGFTDYVTEGQWVWSSGEAVTFTYWGSGEPNNSNNEDFGVINWSGNYWNDLASNGISLGIAEYSVIPEPNSLAIFGIVFGFLWLKKKKK